MRAMVLNTNEESSIVHDINSLKKYFKLAEAIPILEFSTSLGGVNDYHVDDVIGYVDNIRIYKGIFRGDVTPKNKKCKEAIEEHLHEGRLHMALKIDGFKDTEDVINIKEVKEIYYMYLKEGERK